MSHFIGIYIQRKKRITRVLNPDINKHTLHELMKTFEPGEHAIMTAA